MHSIQNGWYIISFSDDDDDDDDAILCLLQYFDYVQDRTTTIRYNTIALYVRVCVYVLI